MRVGPLSHPGVSVAEVRSNDGEGSVGPERCVNASFLCLAANLGRCEGRSGGLIGF